MKPLPTVLLRPGEADRVLAGHPWIYQASILRLTLPTENGAVVQVKDHRQRFLGIGFYNDNSKIRVRMISYQREEADEWFFERRFREALELRQRQMPGVSSFRLVNSESDFLSGLTVDKYEDALVLQISSLGMEQRKPEILKALHRLCSPRAIVERSETAARTFEGMKESRGVLFGKIDGPISVHLNGFSFSCNLLTGHKTGLYLDQQVNYQRVANLARRHRITQALDCFCFQGGFSLHLARATGAHVHGLDQSRETLACALVNASNNALAPHCSFEAVNVFDWLKGQTQSGSREKRIPRFDLIVLDPPSFTRNRTSVPDALRGYKEIHLRALQLLHPGGILVTFCCSHHVSETTFREVIMTAAFDARRILRRLETYCQSPDHPVLPSIPETEYLKGIAFEVVR
jgi:23S rRNA (cytosine1962-C5)-methyltransferase